MFIENHCLPKNSDAIAELGASGHYLCLKKYCNSIKPAGNNKIIIEVPDGTKMKYPHTGDLPFDYFPPESRKFYLSKI